MSSIVISGNTSGSVTLDAPATAGSTVLTLPATSGTILTTATTTGISGSAITTGTVGVSVGGTGQTTYTNGQLLIGNTTGNTLTKATLTAGTGISITNGTGSITIANTGGMTLLGTITPTVVNSISLGSLTLTSYKSLYIVINNVAVTTSKVVYISSNNQQSGGGFGTSTSNVPVSGTAWLDLGTGAVGGGTCDNTFVGTSAIPVGGLTNVATSSTIIYFRVSGANSFVAGGSIVIYGVA